MPGQRTVVIDTDTASDDAVALVMALRSPAVRVAAITVVAGNVDVEQGAANALYTAELSGSNVPVYIGAARPLSRDLEKAEWFHGIDGLGDHGYRPRSRRAESQHAVDALIEVAMSEPGLEVITLGPVTNLALALKREPRIVHNISRCVVMGGAPCCEGNVTPAAEFNIWVDPEAAQMVFRSQLPTEMVGWQLSRKEAVINESDTVQILALKTPLAEFAIRCNSSAADAYHSQTGEYGIALPDPVAMAVLLDPTLVTSASDHYVEVETNSELTRGMTVVDRLGVATDERNRSVWSAALPGRKCRVIWEINVSGWKQVLMRALA